MEITISDRIRVLSILLVFAFGPVASRAEQTPSSPEALGPSVCDVRAYGAVGDGNALDTRAITKAIVACAEAGGGVVNFPPGRYRTGTFELRSNITLYLKVGAVIAGSNNLDDDGGIGNYGFGRGYGVNYTGERFNY